MISSIGPKKLFMVILNAITSVRMPLSPPMLVSTGDSSREQNEEVSNITTFPNAIAQVTITEPNSRDLKEIKVASVVIEEHTISEPSPPDSQKTEVKPLDQLIPHRQHVLCVDDNAINLKVRFYDTFDS